MYVSNLKFDINFSNMFHEGATSGNDTTPPQISNCPPDYTITLPSGINQIVMWWVEPTASDTNGPVTVSQTHHPFEYFSIGVTTVIYTFTDYFGNSVICSFRTTIIGMNWAACIRFTFE